MIRELIFPYLVSILVTVFSSDVDTLNIVEIEIATRRWRLPGGLCLEGGRSLRLRLGLSRLSLSCRLCRNDLLLTLRQSLVHLDHLVIKTVSGRVKLGPTVARVVFIQLFLSLLSALLEEGLSLGLQSCLATRQTIIEDWLRCFCFCFSFSLRRLVVGALNRSCLDVCSL